MSSTETPDVDQTTGEEEVVKKEPLKLQVKIDKPSACERHVTVTVPREDIDRYYEDVFKELLPKAEIPGFRVGKAPRRLVESRFKEHVKEQVKGKLLMDSMTQISDGQDFTAISEPDVDVDVVDIPDDGPMTFEFDIEVRPEFDVPQWKGLKLERPAHTFSDDEVGGHLSRLLDRYGTTQTVDDAAAAGLIVVADITVRHGDQIVAQFPAESLPVRRVLSFTDAKLEGFDKLVEGKKAGDVVTATVTVGKEAERESLRGQQVELEFAIQSVARRALPELTSAFLDKIGGFADETELKMAVREELERQLSYQQQRAIRQQISALLTVAASWSLPPDLLRRQAKRELERSVLELRRSGFSDNEIRAHANELRQNTLGSTERALKEHFILERIAEEEKIDVDPTDYEREISMIAAQSDESERRVRARLEKRGMMDTLRNQIVERKVIDLICLHAEFKDGPYQAPKYDTTAVTHSLASVAEEIPEAKHAPEVQRPGMPSNSGKLPSSSGNKPS